MSDKRKDVLKHEAAALARRIQEIEDYGPDKVRATLQEQRNWYAAKTLLRFVEDVQKYGDLRAFKTKEFGDAFKWNLINPAIFITPEALRKIWKGYKHKANDEYAGNGKTYGQSKTLVLEHVYPTVVLKTRIKQKRFHNLKELAYYALQRSFISITSADEDLSLPRTELRDKDNYFCRYDDINLPCLPLKPEFNNTIRSVVKTLEKKAAKAKKKGLTFKEWVKTVVDAS